MEIGDIIHHRMIMEVDSVAISNSYHYIVKDNTLGSTLDALVGAVHTEWWTQLKDVISDQAATTCSIWANLMGNDPTFAKFQTIAGAVVADNIPAQHAIAIAKKAIKTPSKIANGVNKISGLAETLQNGGHLINYEIGLGLESWLTLDQAYGPTVLKCVLQSFVAGVPQYNEVLLASTNPHIITVPSREPVLCRASGV